MKTLARTSVTVFALAAMLAQLSCVNPLKPFARGSDGYAEAVLPEYDAYVRADAALPQADKDLRLSNSKALSATVRAANAGTMNSFEEVLADVDKRTATLLPQYEAYIKADTKLSDDSKRIRLQSSTGWKSLIETSKHPPK